MVTRTELLQEVESIFAMRPPELVGWPDPNPDLNPPDEAYSRMTNPERWQIVNARADAWADALISLDLAVERTDDVAWEEQSLARLRGHLTRVEVLTPAAAGALPLTMAHLPGEPEAGVKIGVGWPARLHLEPDCLCDACDSGSDDALAVLDDHISDVISGAYRSLAKGDRLISLGDRGWRGRNVPGREVERILKNPEGWSELSGAPWLD